MSKKIIIAVLVIAIACTTIFAMAGCNNKSDWEYIQDKGEMIIGYTLYEPIAYKDENQKLIGFDTELAEAVAADLGLKVKFQLINWDAKETELKSKSIDLIWNGLTIDEDRKANMEISIPYMANKQVAVVQKDSGITDKASMAGKSFAFEKGSAGANVVDKEFPNAKKNLMNAQIDALLEVNSKTSDIAIIDSVMAGFYISKPDFSSLMMIDCNFTDEYYGIAARKGDTEFIGKINASLKKLNESGKVGEIAKKYGLESLITIQ